MKILFVVPNLNIGGITSSLINSCNELQKRGHSVTLLDMSSCGENRGFDKGIEIKHLQGLENYWRLTNTDAKKASGIRKIGLCLLGLIKKITNRNRSSLWDRIIFRKNKEKYDVAVAFRQCAPCYYYVLNKVNADKKIAFIHGDVEYMDGAEKSFLKFMPKFNKIAYVSNAVREGFVKKYPFLSANATTVYNMFDAAKIKKLSQAQNPILFDKSIKNIVTVARVENSLKQIDWIPKICKILKEKTEIKFKWYIVGDGPDMEKDVQLAKELEVDDVVNFVGATDNPFCIIKDADFTVLPSKTEAYPMTVIESLIVGRPVVATEYCSVHEVIKEGLNGMIAKRDLENVVDTVIDMLNDKNNAYSDCRRYLATYEYNDQVAYNQFINAVG